MGRAAATWRHEDDFSRLLANEREFGDHVSAPGVAHDVDLREGQLVDELRQCERLLMERCRAVMAPTKAKVHIEHPDNDHTALPQTPTREEQRERQHILRVREHSVDQNHRRRSGGGSLLIIIASLLGATEEGNVVFAIRVVEMECAEARLHPARSPAEKIHRRVDGHREQRVRDRDRHRHRLRLDSRHWRGIDLRPRDRLLLGGALSQCEDGDAGIVEKIESNSIHEIVGDLRR